jgi:hypothetical protein
MAEPARRPGLRRLLRLRHGPDLEDLHHAAAEELEEEALDQELRAVRVQEDLRHRAGAVDRFVDPARHAVPEDLGRRPLPRPCQDDAGVVEDGVDALGLVVPARPRSSSSSTRRFRGRT